MTRDGEPERLLRILIVEDEELNRKLLRAAIQRRGQPPLRDAELLEAETLAEARRHVAAGGLDLVVLDVRLPDGNGLDLAREITRSDDRARPTVIVLSASVRGADRSLALEAGSDAFLGKPYQPAELVALLEQLVARPRTGRSRGTPT